MPDESKDQQKINEELCALLPLLCKNIEMSARREMLHEELKKLRTHEKLLQTKLNVLDKNIADNQRTLRGCSEEAWDELILHYEISVGH